MVSLRVSFYWIDRVYCSRRAARSAVYLGDHQDSINYQDLVPNMGTTRYFYSYFATSYVVREMEPARSVHHLIPSARSARAWRMEVQLT